MKLLLALILAAPAPKHEWLGSEMPLPLAVRTPQDLQFKNIAEREYLIFNLLSSGKVAWDSGDFATAAAKWESLLSVPGLDPEIDRVVRPFAEEARKKAGGKPGDVPPAPQPRVTTREEAPSTPRRRETAATSVEGTVSGGGAAGPGGAVVMLRRTDGPMPKITPAKKVVLQRGKSFVPRVIAVSEGSSVVFR